VLIRLSNVCMNAATGGEGSSGAPAPAAASTTAPTAPTQPTESAPSAPAEAAPKKTAKELKAELLNGGFRKFVTEQKAAKSAPAQPAPAQGGEGANAATIANAPTEAAQAAAEALADAGKEVPEQKEGESDKRYELRLATLLQRTRELEGLHKKESAGREAAEKRAAENEAKAKEFAERFERMKDKRAALKTLYETTGLTLEDIVKGINAGDIEPHGKQPDLPPEVRKQLEEQRAEIERIKQVEEQRALEQKQAEQQRTFQAHTEQTTKWLAANADDYPILAASEWAPATIVNNAYQSNNLDIATHAKAMEDGFGKSVLSVLGDERAIKALAKRDPAVKERIAKALGLTAAQARAVAQQAAEQAPAPRVAPRAVSAVPSEATTPPDRKPTRAELKAQVLAGLSEMKRQRRAGG